MKSPKKEDTIDLTGSAAKKMKQARLPFKLLTPKLVDPKCNEENASKEKDNEKAAINDEVITGKNAKENAKTEEVIILEDSVELIEEFKEKEKSDQIQNGCASRKRPISVTSPKKVSAGRKRQKTSKTDSAAPESTSTHQLEESSSKDNMPPIEDDTSTSLDEGSKHSKDMSESSLERQSKLESLRSSKSTTKGSKVVLEDSVPASKDCKTSSKDRKSVVKDCKTSSQDRKSVVKDCKTSSQDRKSVVKDCKTSSKDRKSVVKDCKTSSQDRKSVVKDCKTSSQDRKSVVKDCKTSLEKCEQSESKDGDSKSEDGDSKSKDGDSKSISGSSESEDDDSKSKDADSKSENDDTKCKDGDKMSKDGASKSEDGDSESENGDSKSEKILSTPKVDKHPPEGDEPTPKDADSTPKDEVQIQDGGSTPQQKKPRVTSPTSANRTPKARKRTPSQLDKTKESAKKKAEREQKQLEKERLKKEKEDQMNRLKEEKLKMKLDKEEQRKKEKEEKEELKKKEKEEKEEVKKKEKEEKEKKRLAEIELKNEAKRLKEEEKKKMSEAKDEEKRAKEEERRKRDEAKEEEKRKKEAEKRKAAEAFASFFKTKEANNTGEDLEVDGNKDRDNLNMSVVEEMFMPFEVKVDMRLCNTCRRTLDSDTKSLLDEKLLSQDVDCCDLYVELLKRKKHSPLSSEKTWPVIDESDDEVIIIESEVNEGEEEGEHTGGCRGGESKKSSKRYKAKLLQFDENRRPPYWGTWRKKSTLIGGRTPFSLDKTIFEYDVDSDDEWEEEEPGESLRGSDDENEKESEDEYEVDNQVFVPHGYLSDEEMQDEMEDCSREAQKAKLQLLEIEFQAEMNQKTEKLRPRLIGCVWFPNSVSDPASVGSRIAETLLSRRMVLFSSDVTLPIEVNRTADSSPLSSPSIEHTNRKAKFPESAIPMLIKLVHGNRYKLNFLVREFSSYLTKNCRSTLDVPSMTVIRSKIRQMAKWMPFLADENCTSQIAGKMCWYIGKDIRDKYEAVSSDNDLLTWTYILPTPRREVVPPVEQPANEQSPRPANSITKFTKKMTEDERKRQLLQTTPNNSPTATSSTSANKKTLKPSNLLSTFISLKSNRTPVKSSQPNDANDSDVIFISSSKNEAEPDKSLESVTKKQSPVKKRVQLTTLCTFGASSSAKKLDEKLSKCEALKSIDIIEGVESLGEKNSEEKSCESVVSSTSGGLLAMSKSPEHSAVSEEENKGVKQQQKTPTPITGSAKTTRKSAGKSQKTPSPKVSDDKGKSGSKSATKGKCITKVSPNEETAKKQSQTKCDSASASIKSFCVVKKGSEASSKLGDPSSECGPSEVKNGPEMCTDEPKVSPDVPNSSSDVNSSRISETGSNTSTLAGSKVVRSASTSPCKTPPPKKRAKLTTLSPPKWRVKLSKPKLPTYNDSVDDDDDGIVVID